MRLFITGIASSLARALLPTICDTPWITSVFGIDIKEITYQHKKLKTYRLDIRDPEIVHLLRDFDVIIHLAFIVKRENKRMSMNEMFDINVRGSCHVIDAAVKNGITKFINLSTAAVYGSGENMTEQSSYNPSPKFAYANHKMQVEKYLFEKIPTAINFRPHLILGKNTPLYIKAIFRSPTWIKFRKSREPKQQIIHEQDVVQAIMLALTKNVQGSFNLAAPEIIYLLGKYIEGDRELLATPYLWAYFVLGILGIFFKNPEYSFLEMLKTTSTIDCTRAKELLGWQAKFSIVAIRDEVITALNTKDHKVK